MWTRRSLQINPNNLYNQAEAEGTGTFDVADFGLNVPSGEAEVGIGGLTFDPDGSQTITVTDKKITINNLELRQTGGGSLSPFVKVQLLISK